MSAALILFGLWLALCSSSTSVAKAPAGHRPIHLSEQSPALKVGEYAAVFKDSTRELDLAQVKQAYSKGKFSKSEADLDFGFTKDAVWLRVQLENQTNEDLWYVLDSGYPLIDSIQYYELDRQGVLIREGHLGDTVPHYERDFLIRSFAYQLPVKAKSLKTLYIRVQTTGSMSIPIKAYLYSEFGAYLHQSSLILGTFYGIIFGLSIYNLFLWQLTKDREYLLYSLLAASNLGFAITIDGVSFMLLPTLVGWQQVAVYVWLCSSAALGVMFSGSFFDVSNHFPLVHKVMRGLVGLFGIGAVALVLSQSAKLFPLILVITLISLVIVIALALARWRQGYAPARTFLAAWSVMLFSVFFGILASVKLISAYSLTPYFQKVGVVLEMLLLAIALANKIKLLRSLKTEALQAAEAAQAQSKAKSDFLAKMSHEIRTPMNGVLGMAELLRDTSLNEAQANCVQTIQTSGQALLCVINDILDYSKIEAGKMSLEQRFFDLEALLDDLHSIFYNESQEKKIPLLIDLDPDLFLRIQGDEARIRQVLINLVGNAFKFTSQGFISVHVSAASDARSSIRFSVKDTGIGIEKSAQARLFESFSQEDSAVTRKYGGTGLGLAICAQLVALMGGNVGVVSEKGQGSEFFFTIPTVFDPNSRAFEDMVRSQCGHPSQSHILLLCEENLSAQHLAETLRSWGFTVETQRVAKDLPESDLVILHESLDSEARQAFIAITETLAWSYKGVLIRTTHHESLDVSSCRNIGRVKCLVLPCGRFLMRATMIKLLQDPLTQSGQNPLAMILESELDYSDMRVLVAEDNKVNQAVIRGMLRRFSITPTIANNGRQAVQACERACFDLILMDCEMPELDGYEAAQEIRKLPSKAGEGTLIFALTAHALSEHRDQAVQAGMDDHLTKPLSIEALRDALRDAKALIQRAA